VNVADDRVLRSIEMQLRKKLNGVKRKLVLISIIFDRLIIDTLECRFNTLGDIMMRTEDLLARGR